MQVAKAGAAVSRVIGLSHIYRRYAFPFFLGAPVGRDVVVGVVRQAHRGHDLSGSRQPQTFGCLAEA